MAQHDPNPAAKDGSSPKKPLLDASERVGELEALFRGLETITRCLTDGEPPHELIMSDGRIQTGEAVDALAAALSVVRDTCRAALAPKPQPPGAPEGERRKDEIRAAYIAGATKVLAWLDMPTDDLDEGADDYFASLAPPTGTPE